jgi:sigma-B regulation protein RsbU (phosphoserine phosphatase)
MMTARIAGLMTSESVDQNIALRLDSAGQRDVWPPAQVASRLNALMLDDLQVEQYFTLAYAEIHLDSGSGILVQAGHPHPTILRASGAIELLGDGGMPIGLISGVGYDEVTFQLNPGDRLMLLSDGITECANPSGEELGHEGLAKMLKNNAALSSPDLLEALIWDLTNYSGANVFADDVSSILIDYRGAI